MATVMTINFPKILSGVRQIRPELIYTSQQLLDAQLGSTLSLLFGIPHVFHIHYPVGPWLGKTLLQVLKRGGYFIAVSDFMRRSLIYNGIEPVRCFIRAKKSQLNFI